MYTVVITGANRGLGLEMVRQYAMGGWRVIACCREPEKAEELHKLSKDIKILQLDVSSIPSIRGLVDHIDNQPVDILLNNAGVLPQEQEFGTIEAELLIDTFKINTLAPFILAETLFKNIVASELKVIANMSSIMASMELNTSGGYYAYRSTKAALNALTKSMAIDLKTHHIKVVALHPGWAKTDMGGVNATVEPEDSVQKIRKILSQLNLIDSGSFISYDGTKLAW